MTAYMPVAQTDDWATPQYLFDEWNKRFTFVTDAAASSTNHKLSQWFGLDHPDEDRRDGLEGQWLGNTWINPPYGRGIINWLEKAHKHDSAVVLLLPSRTDTKWFHDYCLTATQLHFIRGRVKFGAGKASAPFPSMVVVVNG